MGNAKVYLKQAVFILAVIAVAKLAQTSMNTSKTSGIGLYLP